jgi:hypothetical protein
MSSVFLFVMGFHRVFMGFLGGYFGAIPQDMVVVRATATASWDKKSVEKPTSAACQAAFLTVGIWAPSPAHPLGNPPRCWYDASQGYQLHFHWEDECVCKEEFSSADS